MSHFCDWLGAEKTCFHIFLSSAEFLCRGGLHRVLGRKPEPEPEPVTEPGHESTAEYDSIHQGIIIQLELKGILPPLQPYRKLRHCELERDGLVASLFCNQKFYHIVDCRLGRTQT